MSGPRDGDVDAIRQFNRFYTRLIGALDDGYLQSAYSLAEVRVLYELAHRERATARELCRDLSLDPGYASRILRRFARERLISRVPAADRRQALLTITRKGRRVFAPLNDGARRRVQSLIEPLTRGERVALVQAMRRIERLLRPTR